MPKKIKRTILKSLFPLILLFVLMGCGATPPEMKTSTPRNTSLVPTTTSPPPTATSLPEVDAVKVPSGEEITIDGSFLPGEWDEALKISLDGEGTLMLSRYHGDLFLGLQSSAMSFGSVCIVRDEQIVILHSSAALGTAIYELDASHWNLTQEFSWCCRSMSSDSEKETLFKAEGWLASTGRMGAPNQMEYQIALDSDDLTLAVVFQEVAGNAAVHWWPEKLNDGCLDLVQAGTPLPESLSFSPDTWETIILRP